MSQPANRFTPASAGKQFWPRVMLAGVILLAAAAYSPVRNAPFTFDDAANLVDNPLLPREHLDLKVFLSSSGRRPNPFRPAAYFSFALNFILFGPAPRSFHLVNLVIHLLSGITLFLLLSRLFAGIEPGRRSLASSTLALAITALWTVHPVHTEAVSYVVQRMTSLSGLCYLLALLSYLHARTAVSIGKRGMGIVGVILFGALACATKETAFTLPVFLLAGEYFFFSSSASAASRRAWRIGLLALLAAAALAAGLILGPFAWRWISHGYALRGFTLTERLLTETRVLWYYLFLAFFPLPQLLRLQYDFVISRSLFQPVSTLLAVAGWTALAAAFCFGARRKQLWALALFWFLGQLALESSVIPLEIAYEHRLYLPLLGPVSALAGLALVPGRWHRARALAVGAIVLLWAADTYVRNQVWRDNLALWRDAVSKAPTSARAWSNLGKVYREQGRLGPAIQAYRQALRRDPRYPHAYLNLSGIYSQQGDIDHARWSAEQALALEPSNPRTLLAMAEVEKESGHLSAAFRWYQRAWRTRPQEPRILENLISGFLDMEQPELAAQVMREYERLYPHQPGVFFFWGNYYYSAGRWQEAAQAYEQALALDPRSTSALNNLAVVWQKLGRPERAAAYLHQAIALAPDNGMLQENLCEVYLDLNQLDQAEAACRRATLLQPDGYSAWKKLAAILLQRGRMPEAREALEQAKRLATEEDEELDQMLSEVQAGPGAVEE